MERRAGSLTDRTPPPHTHTSPPPHPPHPRPGALQTPTDLQLTCFICFFIFLFSLARNQKTGFVFQLAVKRPSSRCKRVRIRGSAVYYRSRRRISMASTRRERPVSSDNSRRAQAVPTLRGNGRCPPQIRAASRNAAWFSVFQDLPEQSCQDAVAQSERAAEPRTRHPKLAAFLPGKKVFSTITDGFGFAPEAGKS